jgi:hypothetical protein
MSEASANRGAEGIQPPSRTSLECNASLYPDYVALALEHSATHDDRKVYHDERN